MKNIFLIIPIIIASLFNVVIVDASSGRLRKDSIKTCNGIVYGQHSEDNHWHVAEKQGNWYYANGEPIYTNPCLSNNVQIENSIDNNSNNSSTNNDEINNDNNIDTNDNSKNKNTNENTTTQKQTKYIRTTTKVNDNETTTKPHEIIKSKDNTLKEITIDNEQIEIKDNIEFITQKEKINIKAIPNDKNANVVVLNNNNLIIGNNEIIIQVTAEDESQKKYFINIKREKLLSSETGIELTINNKKINFKNNKATINVYASENKVNVSYILKDEKAKIKMNKIQNLKKGDNILNIEIIAENGTKVDYEVTIYKYSKVEEIIYTIIFIIWFCGIVYLIYYFSKKIKTLTKIITKRK